MADDINTLVTLFPSKYGEELRAVLPAVLNAGRLCIEFRASEDFAAMLKADASPVTIADVCSQVLLVEAIQRVFPADLIFAEENADSVQEGMAEKIGFWLKADRDWTRYLKQEQQPVGEHSGVARFWTVDPIDGTKGYVRGNQFSICVALVEGAQPVLSVISCPSMVSAVDGAVGCLFVGVQGSGVYEVRRFCCADLAGVAVVGQAPAPCACAADYAAGTPAVRVVCGTALVARRHCPAGAAL